MLSNRKCQYFAFNRNFDFNFFQLTGNNSNIDKIRQSLDARTREVNFLYAVDEILNDMDSPVRAVLNKLIRTLPGFFQYPDICQVKIELNNETVSSEKFILTDLKITQLVTKGNNNYGSITISYSQPFRAEKGAFLTHEKMFLKTLANKLLTWLEVKNLKEEVDRLHDEKQENYHTSGNSDEALLRWLKEKHLSEKEINEFTKVRIEYRKSEMICKQGALAPYIMLLASGMTKNYLEGTQDRGFNFSIVRAIDFIGLSSLFGNSQYLFSGTALTSVVVYHIQVDYFKQVVHDNHQFGYEIMQWFGKISQKHLSRLACIGNKQALGRVADVLLYLSDNVFDNKIITPVISRKDIAELAAMSTESAVRILSGLKHDGILRIQTGGIEIIKREFLEKLSFAG